MQGAAVCGGAILTEPERRELEPVTGDIQQGPSDSNMDNAIVEIHHVPSQLPIKPCVNLYAIGWNDLESITWPFIHTVELKGVKGTATNMDGLFNEGALV